MRDSRGDILPYRFNERRGEVELFGKDVKVDDGLLFAPCGRRVCEVLPVVEEDGEAYGCGVRDLWEIRGEVLKHRMNMCECVVVSVTLRVCCEEEVAPFLDAGW